MPTASARALAAQPSLLVADEPISALDASTQARVAGLMKALCLEAGAGLLGAIPLPDGQGRLPTIVGEDVDLDGPPVHR